MVPENIGNNLEGEGGLKRPKFLKRSMTLNWNFQRWGGGGSNPKKTSVGGVWIFSGTTHGQDTPGNR